MRGVLIACAIGAAVMIVHGYAQSERLDGGSYIARVEQVFVEVQPGVYTPQAKSRRTPGMPRWVNVTFPQPLEDGRTGATARVPPELIVNPGDLVMLRFAGLSDSPLANEISAVAPRNHVWIR